MLPRRKTWSVLIYLIPGLTAAALVYAPDLQAKPVKLPETFSANAQVKGASAPTRVRTQPSNPQKPTTTRPVR
jgi:hypothetical protein